MILEDLLYEAKANIKKSDETNLNSTHNISKNKS